MSVATMSKTNGVNHAARDKTAYSVLMTYDYDKFKLMPNNRIINMLHVRRLMESFKFLFLICPIIVNEKFHVIDGQHRLRVCKELGLPVYYIMIPGYGIKEVQVLNANQSNWKKMDHLKSYCAEGVPAYLEFKKFMDDFPDFNFQSIERIIQLRVGGDRQQKKFSGKSVHQKYFEEGKLQIPNIQRSYIVARKIMDFKTYTNRYNDGKFVSCIIPLLVKSKTYDHKEMLYKLSNCPNKLVKCADSASYRMLLEDIYNYKRLKENKVSFRYE